MRRDVAPEDQVEQLTLTETTDTEPTAATDEESIAYVTRRLGRTAPAPADAAVAPGEPDWLVEAFALPPLEPRGDDDAAPAPARVVEPAWVEDAFWSVRIGSEATSRR